MPSFCEVDGFRLSLTAVNYIALEMPVAGRAWTIMAIKAVCSLTTGVPGCVVRLGGRGLTRAVSGPGREVSPRSGLASLGPICQKAPPTKEIVFAPMTFSQTDGSPTIPKWGNRQAALITS